MVGDGKPTSQIQFRHPGQAFRGGRQLFSLGNRGEFFRGKCRQPGIAVEQLHVALDRFGEEPLETIEQLPGIRGLIH